MPQALTGCYNTSGMRFGLFIFAAALAAAFFARSEAPAAASDERWLGGCGVDAEAVSNIDSDGDGLNDAVDKCPFEFGEHC